MKFMKSIAALTAVAAVSLFGAQADAQTSKGKILVILSSETSLPLQGGKTFSTGYYLNEVMVPVERFLEAGYEIDFADPKGNTPAVDKASVSADYFGGSKDELEKAQNLQQSLPKLAHPLRLSSVAKSDLEKYKAVFVPGGPAPMIDLMADRNLGSILRYFHTHHKTTILLCHGPIALLAATNDPARLQAALRKGDAQDVKQLSANWPYAGYKMTVFTNSEEEQAASNVFHAEPLFRPEDALRLAGGNIQNAETWQSNVVEDRELITGQNPFSDKAMMDLVLNELAGK